MARMLRKQRPGLFFPFADGRCAAWFVDDPTGLKATLAIAGR